MPSPFPGMDPYLEEPGLWPDVHHGLTSEMRAALNRQLRPKYRVRVEERVYVSDENDLIEDEIHEARLEIVDRFERSVVTVIELLSPTNKVTGSRGRASYEDKRQEVMHSPSHFVEIDLLRAGAPLHAREALPKADYYVHVSRGMADPRGWSGRFGCPNDCRRSRFLCGRRTPTQRSICSKCWTLLTSGRPTTWRLTIDKLPCRPCRRNTRSGPTGYCATKSFARPLSCNYWSSSGRISSATSACQAASTCGPAPLASSRSRTGP